MILQKGTFSVHRNAAAHPAAARARRRLPTSLGLAVLLAVASQAALAQSGAVGRETAAEYVFDVTPPADFVAAVTAADPRYARFRPLVRRQTHTTRAPRAWSS